MKEYMKGYDISRNSIEAYWKQYPNGGCCYCEPDNLFVVENKKTEKSYYAPEGENDETFMDRLKRSKAAGRNLFFEEWDEYIPEKGVDY